MMRRILLVTLAFVAAVTTACSSDDPPQNGSLPDGAGLLKDASAAAAKITSAHFTLAVNGKVPGLSVRNAEGDITSEGDTGAAKGTVSMDLMGSLFEGEFVLVDDKLFVKGPTGGWQALPASLVRSLYDPAALLDPKTGIAHVLDSVTEPRTEAAEDVDGVATYKVTGRVTKDVVSSLVPGIDSDVDVSFWVRQDGDHAPVKASVRVPAEGDPTVDVTLADVNKQVSITAPQ